MDAMRLKRQGVTHVLNAAEGDSFMHVNTNAEFYAGTGIAYHGVPASDTDHFDIGVYFEEAAEFIEEALASKSGKGWRIEPSVERKGIRVLVWSLARPPVLMEAVIKAALINISKQTSDT